MKKVLDMVRILVAYATRMGSTAEIAQTIGRELAQHGLQVTVSPCAEAGSVGAYDAVFLGTGVYLGRWDPEAVAYLDAQAADLTKRPTWLFQSGPVGEGAEDEQIPTPHKVLKRIRRLGIERPVTFGGRLDRSTATDPLAHWLTTGALAGDYRDWDRIRTWAAGKADELLQPPTGASSELSAARGISRMPGPNDECGKHPPSDRDRTTEGRSHGFHTCTEGGQGSADRGGAVQRLVGTGR